CAGRSPRPAAPRCPPGSSPRGRRALLVEVEAAAASPDPVVVLGQARKVGPGLGVEPLRGEFHSPETTKYRHRLNVPGVASAFAGLGAPLLRRRGRSPTAPRDGTPAPSFALRSIRLRSAPRSV